MADNKSIETLVAQLLRAVDGLIDWGAIPEDVRRKKYSIVAKRVDGIARSARTLDEFLERLLKEIAGDALFISGDKAQAFIDARQEVKSSGLERELLQYIKKHPYLSVIAYAELRKEASDDAT